MSDGRMGDGQRILIEGVGGIGGVVAAKLIEAGSTPLLVTHNPQITEAIRRDGLRLTTPEGRSTVQAQVYTGLEEVPVQGGFDIVFLIMKAAGVTEAARATLPLLKPDGYVVTFQNGIVEDAVGGAIGQERVVAATIGWGGTMHAPGVYEKTSGGATHIGELDRRISDRVRALAALLETSAPVVISSNVRGVLWSKLAINCTITTIGALTGDTLGVMLQERQARRLFLRTYREVVDTALTFGIKLERIAANPMLLYVPQSAGPLTRLVKDFAVRLVGRRYGKVKSSSLQSLERGRKTEIDYLNGYVVAQAQTVGVPTPANAALVRMIKAIEAGERPISRQNLAAVLDEIAE